MDIHEKIQTAREWLAAAHDCLKDSQRKAEDESKAKEAHHLDQIAEHKRKIATIKAECLESCGVNHWQSAVEERSHALELLRIEAAAVLCKDMTGHEIGTVLCEWSRGRSWGFGPWGRTGRRAVVSVWTHDDKPPANQQYGAPQPGDFYLRILKKCGTPSKLFESIHFAHKWLPVGVKMEAK